MALYLNGFHLTLSATHVAAYEAEVEPGDVDSAREQLGKRWFSYFHEGKLFSVPRGDATANPLGCRTTIALDDHRGMKIVAAMVTDVIPSSFPKYQPVREKPFTFVAQLRELVSEATSDWQNVHALVNEFAIRPKYELDARLTEIRDGELRLALTLMLTTRWVCNASLEALLRAGVPLDGLHILRRDPLPKQRRLVGRIDHLRGDHVVLREAYDATETIGVDEVKLEGSRESFAHCLRFLLRNRYDQFSRKVDSLQGELSDGPGLNKMLDDMGKFLRSKNPLTLPGKLTCSVGERVRIGNQADFKSFVQLRPARYCFDRSRTKLADYAWVGLQRFGPFDRESFPKRTPRILVVCPDRVAGRVSQAMQLFRDGIVSIEDSRFANGFAGTFRLVNPEFVPMSVELFGVANEDVCRAYRRAIEEQLARDSNFDAAVNVLLDEHSVLPDPINPYLTTKAVMLANGIPVQEAKASTLMKDPVNLQYIFQNVASALYAKMGGIPWTVDHGETADDELVIGLGTAELSGSRFEARQRHIGITTVFRGDGNYLLSHLSHECSYKEYPKVLRESTVRVLRDVKTRNQWQPGQTIRIVFHAFKPLRNVEVADITASCVKEVGDEQNIEFAFLTVSHDHSFSLIDDSESGLKPRYGSGSPKGVFVPARGMVVQLGRYTRLLCTTGPRMVKRPNLPLPRPLLIHLHKQSTYRDFPYLADQVLKFTALSWRSTLPTDRPVTILYSTLIAGLLGRLQTVSGWSPAVLNTKLRNSKWFL